MLKDSWKNLGMNKWIFKIPSFLVICFSYFLIMILFWLSRKVEPWREFYNQNSETNPRFSNSHWDITQLFLRSLAARGPVAFADSLASWAHGKESQRPCSVEHAQPRLKLDKLRQHHGFPQKIRTEAKETTKDGNKRGPDRVSAPPMYKRMSLFSGTVTAEIKVSLKFFHKSDFYKLTEPKASSFLRSSQQPERIRA